MNGIKNEIILKSMKRVMEKNNIEVLFITETLGTEIERKKLERCSRNTMLCTEGEKG